MTFQVYDTTLRDGAQREGISYSVVDKLAVARLLDDFGVGFIEGGWPGAMPKDTEFFRRARTELDLRHAVLVAFGATRKAGVKVADDPQVRALLDAETPAVCLVAKSDIRHVERALRTTGAENLAMVTDTVAHFVAEGRRVFLDCEHFFDGFRHDPAYTASVVSAAAAAGAEVVVMCDTNGGMLPSQIGAAIADLVDRTGLSADRLGIHCQNDTSCAVANTIAAVEAGVRHFQGTANGYGERPGNADLFAVVANLQLKLGLPVLPDGCLEQMVRVSHAIAEIANIAPDTHQAYVGAAAFAHKAGLHASAIKVDPLLYNHVDPSVVGNDMRILVTEMAGRASIELKSRELGVDLAGHPDALSRVTKRVKELEAGGWSFEAADASFELLVRSELAADTGAVTTRPFALESYRVLVEHREDGAVVSEATVKVRVRGERVIATAEGNGPVNALDEALRVALRSHYPDLADFRLADYKVRILEGSQGTGAITRVLVETVDGNARDWTTVGVHENVVEASWHALVDALTYGLARSRTTTGV
ncbi:MULTISPECIES: citramalate synthase [unclassified Solwaraspora]|uniref:citramalate synthase n=1 Tax=unclassified Solwaraspora TaxID=2627926 RepID=UPI00248C567E|nr:MULTISPECIES: citramalate synthase [unclassified Solwaraspora]WBB98433.1 citramalate synthase [Solwaraspora sp. WMMA2059]WBC23014.1 citramalate synthase [Solwaraspora sp. WMMA2080]WJK34951.1 citramalate synthase [Solwaraspora sp. WMMA2065]